MDLAQSIRDEAERQRQAAANNVAMSGRDPVAVARAKRLSDAFGLPAPLIEADPKPFDMQLRRAQTDDTLSAFPALTPHLTSSPDTAAMLGKSDLPIIGDITQTLGFGRPPAQSTAPAYRQQIETAGQQSRPAGATPYDFGKDAAVPVEPTKWTPWTTRDYVTKVPQAIGDAAASGVIMTHQSLASGLEFVTDKILDDHPAWLNSTADSLTQSYRDIQKQDEASLKAWQPTWIDSPEKQAAFDGATSLAQMLIPIPVVGKAKALYTLAGATGLLAYQKYRSRGVSTDTATLGGAAEGAIEYVTELPFAHYVLSGKFLSKSIKDLGHFAIGELGGEQIATAGQDAVEQAIAPQDPNHTWADYLKDRPAAAWSTLIATATMLGAVEGVHLGARGAQALAQRKVNAADKLDGVGKDARDATLALHGEAVLEHLIKQADKTELRKNSPEAFAKFVSEASSQTGITHIHVPIEAIDRMLADTELPDQERSMLSLYQDQIDEARAENGDVSFPIGEALAHFPGTKLWEGIKDDSRVFAEGVSPKVAKTKIEALTTEMEAAAQQVYEQAQTLTPQIEAKASVYSEVKQQVLAAGKSEKEAKTTAALLASRADALATERYGQFADAKAAWKWMQLQIVGPDAKVSKGKAKRTGQEAAPVSQQTLNSTATLHPEDENGFPAEDIMSSEGDGTHDPMVLQQFGGQVGAHNLIGQTSKRYEAQAMEEEGEDPKAIWKATGWMRGADGLWRFEIDDSQAELGGMPDPELNEEGLVESEHLQYVLRHPTLYRAYPSLANMPVFAMELEDGVQGYFDGTKIVLSTKTLAVGGDKLKTLLLHEIQHTVQTIEGFNNGASADLETLYNMGLGAAFEQQYEEYERINDGKVPDMKFDYHQTPDGLARSAAWKVYSRVLGEVEARNTETRFQLTSAGRLAKYPDLSADIPREQWLISQPVHTGMSQSSSAPPTGPRGEASFFPSGKTVVQLFAKSDFSTMLHEMSHVFLQQEFTLAKSDKASPELKADIETLKAWFAKHGGSVDENGIPDREAHELFARTGERYFREGKAPSTELRAVFKQLSDWLTGVYKSVKDLLVHGPAPITPEISEIMDRMIATGEAIRANATSPMSQEELGMTSAEYDAYVASVSDARDAAFDTLLERMMKAVRRREGDRARGQRANIRAEVADEVNKDPMFVALHLLRTGRWLNDSAREATPIKLNTGWLIDNYGEEVLKQLPVGLQPLHRGDGVVGDVLAELVGASSGDALVKGLIAMKQQADQLKADGNPRPLRDQMIEDETNKIMAERHGDIAMSEDQIREEAIASLNSARQGEVLATELRQLRKKNSVPGVVTPYQLLREWARRKVNEGKVADAVSKSALQRYIRGFNKARNLFEDAILKGDSNEAIKQKQAQMINHALLAEGKVVADEIGVIIRRMQRYSKVKAMASIDQDYMDRVHELLEAYNFRNTSDRARAEQASFEAWAEGQRALGHEVLVPTRFRDDRVNWKDAQVGKLLELNDMVQSLVAQGKLKQRLITAQGERELAATIDDIESRILNLPDRKLPESSTGTENRPFKQAIREAKNFADYRSAVGNLFNRGTVRGYVAGLIKVEGLLDNLDGVTDGTGPLNQTVLRGATDAANLYSKLLEEVLDPLVARYRSMGKQGERLQDFVTIPELTLNVSIHPADSENLGKPLNIPRSKLIGLLLNTGNLSNLSKLVGGERWGNPESATDLARVRDILISHASKADLDLVQDVWNGVSKLWPHIVRVERELSGVVPEEVVPTSFDTPHGPYSGGYWPVVWDSTRSEMGKKQGEEAETSLQGVGFGISTPKGHTITRTGAMAPIEWGFEHVLFGHINKVISRVAYAPWVRDTLKVVDNLRVTGAIRLRLGSEYVAAIKPWIKDQIPSNHQDIPGAKSWEKFLNQVRINMSVSVLGLSYTTGIAQTLGLGYSAGVLGDNNVITGGRWMGRGMKEMLKLQKSGALGAQEFVFARSEEMQRRAHETSREATEVFNRLHDNDTVYHRMQAAAFWHIGFIDLNMVAIPTWLGGYHKMLSQGATEQEAIDYAEKAVRLSQGSGRKKDLSAIQRGTAGQKFISMFYTPSSVFFNQQWKAVQDLKAGNFSAAAAPTFWFLAMSTIGDALLAGDWPDDDDPETIAAWIARNMAFGMFYGIPFVRDLSNTAERQLTGRYATYGSTPISYGAETIGRGAGTAKKLIEGKPLEGRDVKNGVAAAGYLLGLPGNQLGKTGGYLKDVYDGKERPDTPYDWYSGIAYGTPQAKK